MLNHYSNAEFTFPSDRLIAISSLAAKTAEHTDGPYETSCWLESIDRCLAWQATLEPPGAVRGVCHDLSTPSWSWASLPGEIQYVSGGFWTGVVALGEDIEHLKSGKLRSRGRVWRGSLSELGLNLSPDTKYKYESLHDRRNGPLL